MVHPKSRTFVAVSLLQIVPPSHKEDPIVLPRCTSAIISRSPLAPLRSAMLRLCHSCSTNRMALVPPSSLSVAFQCMLCPAAQLSFPPASSRDFLWPVHRPRCLHVDYVHFMVRGLRFPDDLAPFSLMFDSSLFACRYIHLGTDEDGLQV